MLLLLVVLVCRLLISCIRFRCESERERKGESPYELLTCGASYQNTFCVHYISVFPYRADPATAPTMNEYPHSSTCIRVYWIFFLYSPHVARTYEVWTKFFRIFICTLNDDIEQQKKAMWVSLSHVLYSILLFVFVAWFTLCLICERFSVLFHNSVHFFYPLFSYSFALLLFVHLFVYFTACFSRFFPIVLLCFSLCCLSDFFYSYFQFENQFSFNIYSFVPSGVRWA